MPLEVHPMTPADALAWTRIRSFAYRGPTHDVLHNGPISESSIQGVAQERARDIGRPNSWHWKVIDTALEPSADDPFESKGRTIAIGIWSLRNVTSSDGEGNDKAQQAQSAESYVVTNASGAPPIAFVPPELRLDALNSLMASFSTAKTEIMGTSDPYYMLESLATHPEQQGRGAGSMLLEWGLKKVDESGLSTYLSATAAGKRLYDKVGFEVVRKIEWDRAPWGGEGTDGYVCMVRPAREEASALSAIKRQDGGW